MAETTNARDHLITVQCRIAELARIHNGGELEIGDEVMIPWGEVNDIVKRELFVWSTGQTLLKRAKPS
jgi:hypothetical protein